MTFTYRFSVLPIALALIALPALAGPFPPVLDLSTLRPEHGGDGRHGIVLRTLLAGASGWNVDAAAAGDLNGDGIADVALGAPTAYEPGVTHGAGFVVFGRAGLPARFDLDALDGSDGFRLDAGPADPRQNSLGKSVAAAGDVNADGIGDLLIASHHSVFLVFGHASDGGFPARVDLGALDGTQSARIDMGRTPMGDASVRALGPAGDLDGDGVDDFFAGNSIFQILADGEADGALWGLFGRKGFPAAQNAFDLDGSDGFRIDGRRAMFKFGAGGVSATHDVNGDGRADIVISDSSGGLVLFGRPGPLAAVSELPVLDGGNGFAFAGGTHPDFIVSAGGDLNGDGHADLAFSEGRLTAYDPWIPGRHAFVVFGGASSYPARLAAEDLDGSNGFRYRAEQDAAFGSAQVAMVGDVNGDGVDDLAVHSAHCCGDTHTQRSVVHVIFGRRDGFPAQLDESVLDGERGFRIDVSANHGEAGRIAGLGDFNADGIDDMVIAINHNEGGFPGQIGDFAYVIYGRASSLFTDGFDGRADP